MRCPFFHDSIRRTFRRHVRGGRCAPVYDDVRVRNGVTEFGREEKERTGTRTFAPKPPRATDEDGGLIFKKELSRVFVPGVDEGRDGCSLSLVQDFEQPVFRGISDVEVTRPMRRVKTHRVSFTRSPSVGIADALMDKYCSPCRSIAYNEAPGPSAARKHQSPRRVTWSAKSELRHIPG